MRQMKWLFRLSSIQKAAFCDIADCLEEVMQRHRPSKDPDIGELMRVDAEARRTAEAILEV